MKAFSRKIVEMRIEMKINEIKKVGFIGLGLIGGCIARRIKQTWPDINIIAYDYSYAKKGKHSVGLLLAKSDTSIDNISIDINDFEKCQLIFLCAPVSSNMKYLEILKDVVDKNCIITDVGSVKGCMHSKAKELGMEWNFVGGHPMAGSEKTGYENSFSSLLEKAYYVITKTEESDSSKVEIVYEIATKLKAIPLVLEPKQHDDSVAAISHLPHIMAFSLVNLVKEKDNSDKVMKSIAAGGFKDTTRIASSSPAMWESILSTNKESILKMLDSYIEELSSFKNDIENNNSESIVKKITSARDYRDTYNKL